MISKVNGLICLIASGILLVGCGANGTTTPAANNAIGSSPTVDTSPVTLSIFMDTGAPDQFVQDNIVKPVEKKFPNITLEVVKKTPKTTADQLVAAGKFPDLVYTSPPFLKANNLESLGLLYDLTPMINKYHMDLNAFNARIIDQLRKSGKPGELDVLPFYINYTALFYNKSVFDKLGVAYPTDGMTWDQVIKLGKKLSKTVDGVAYQGFVPTNAEWTASELSLPWVDPKTNKALLDTDNFRNVLQVLQDSYNAENHMWKSNTSKDTLAMFTAWGDQTQTYVSMGAKAPDWDMVTEPVFSGSSGNAVRVDSHDLMISSTSTHKDLDFQVISYLVSKEYQLDLVKNGYVSALTDPDLQKNFAVNVPELKGKHLEAIFKSKPAPIPTPTPYDVLATRALNKYGGMVANGQMDINTALSKAEDEANQNIQAAIQQGK